MVRSPAPTSPSTPNATVTRAPQARNWSSPGAPTQSHEAASGPRGKGSIAISNGVLNGDALLHNKLRPIAVVDDQCPGAVAASKIEGAALLAIEARYLAGFKHQTHPSRRNPRQPIGIALVTDHEGDKAD